MARSDEYAAKAKTEHGHQTAFFMWAAENRNLSDKLKKLYAIPNGGARNAATAAMLKAEGVKAGFPDIGLPVARHGYHGLFIEMKKPGGTLQKNQRDEWHPWINEEGYLVATCYNFWEARACVCWYLGLDVNQFQGAPNATAA